MRMGVRDLILLLAAATCVVAAVQREEIVASLLSSASKQTLPQMGMFSLIRFVDTTGAFQHKFVVEDEMNSEELVRAHFQLHQLTSAQQEEILGMLHAVEYAEKLLGGSGITVQDMVEMNARIVGRSSPDLLTHNGSKWLDTDYLSKLNSVMASLKQKQDKVESAIGAFRLAAWSMDALGAARPFQDGNARLAELVNAIALTSVPGLPFPQRLGGHSLFTNALVDLGHDEHLVTNAINSLSMHTSWLELDASAGRGVDGIWRFVSTSAYNITS